MLLKLLHKLPLKLSIALLVEAQLLERALLGLALTLLLRLALGAVALAGGISVLIRLIALGHALIARSLRGFAFRRLVCLGLGFRFLGLGRGAVLLEILQR